MLMIFSGTGRTKKLVAHLTNALPADNAQPYVKLNYLVNGRPRFTNMWWDRTPCAEFPGWEALHAVIHEDYPVLRNWDWQDIEDKINLGHEIIQVRNHYNKSKLKKVIRREQNKRPVLRP